MTKRAIVSLAGVVLMSTACTLGPNWEKPQMEVPAVFRGAGMSGSNMSDLPWQAVMKDRNLQALLNDVFAHNRSLQALEHNVEAARQYVTAARAPLFPWVLITLERSRGLGEIADERPQKGISPIV